MTDSYYKKYSDLSLDELEAVVEDLENMSLAALKSKKKDFRITILKTVQEAKKEIESEKAKALKDIKSVAVNLSVEAASKIINKNLDSNDNKKIAEDTINSIN